MTYATPASGPVEQADYWPSRRLFSEIGMTGWIVLAIPALRPIEVVVVGRTFLREIICAALLPFLLLSKGRALLKPFPAVFLCLAVFWAIDQFSTDLFRDTPSSDYLRGWAKIAFTAIFFMSIYLLINGRGEYIAMYLVGLVCGMLLDYLLTPSEFASLHPWKFGMGLHTTFAVFLCACYADRIALFAKPLWPAAFAALIGLTNLYLGFRSLGGVCLMAALFLVIWSVRKKSKKRFAPENCGPSSCSQWFSSFSAFRWSKNSPTSRKPAC